jgi:type I restriction enzyme S subunit
MKAEGPDSPPGRTWLYEPTFPDEWVRRPLYVLADWVNGLAFRDIQFSPAGLPVIKIAEIKDGVSGQTKFTSQSFDESVRVRSGDLLYSWSGQPETSIDAYWWRGPDGWLNQHIFKVTPRIGVDPVFLYYLLRYLKPNFVGIARNKQTTGLGHVTRRDLENLRVGLPLIEEQRAIARVLGSLDDKIELNRRMSETLEAMARALFKSWFVDFEPVRAKAQGRDPGLPQAIADLFPNSMEESELGEIPAGWRVGPLRAVADLAVGGDWGRDVPLDGDIEVRCLRGVDIDALRRTGWSDAPRRYVSAGSLEKRLPSPTDVLIEGSGECGRSLAFSAALATVYAEPIIYSNFCKRFVTHSAGMATYVEYVLNGLVERGEMKGFVTGTAMPNLDHRGLLSSQAVVIPPDPLLLRFADFVATVRSRLFSAESRTLADIRDTLLPRLISGEIRVPEAERMLKAAPA